VEWGRIREHHGVSIYTLAALHAHRVGEQGIQFDSKQFCSLVDVCMAFCGLNKYQEQTLLGKDQLISIDRRITQDNWAAVVDGFRIRTCYGTPRAAA